MYIPPNRFLALGVLMTAAKQHACPHCGSKNNRILADHLGRIGWCKDCHRTWEQTPARVLHPVRLGAEVLSHDSALLYKRRHI